MIQTSHFVRSAVAACLLAIGLPAGPAFAGEPDAALIAEGEALFDRICRRCHAGAADAEERVGYGPSLIGVVGREAGSVEGFAYSEALSNSGIVWTEAALAAWMADNDHMLPGTRMRHVGVEDMAEQKAIVAYLKSTE
ncbi:cytochrome c family protein [Notoacmeibacter sp. MSK16QG-6]|uniref:c-type cytochrome n=1 Tax=Notoacmeibacter sp. MSK16QG-6 TaxID=2957982 RepID=UPI00209F81BC|nr:c-type cytochrome [Notoacmeibacter sp. MSK16QG-6]MCP1199847.1 c-type cytochrome [Notoacmeibacter sp. MSK16QG-6]